MHIKSPTESTKQPWQLKKTMPNDPSLSKLLLWLVPIDEGVHLCKAQEYPYGAPRQIFAKWSKDRNIVNPSWKEQQDSAI